MTYQLEFSAGWDSPDSTSTSAARTLTCGVATCMLCRGGGSGYAPPPYKIRRRCPHGQAKFTCAVCIEAKNHGYGPKRPAPVGIGSRSERITAWRKAKAIRAYEIAYLGG